MIPGLLDKSRISYGWSGYDSVEVFSSQSQLTEYEAFFRDHSIRVEKIQDDGGCIQFRLFLELSDDPAYEIFAASLESEDDVWDIESYVGEAEFAKVDRSVANTIGALFSKADDESKKPKRTSRGCQA